MQEAKRTNSFGIRYLSKGRYRYGKLYAVKIEVGCANGKHGLMVHFYEGSDYELAVWFANRVNELISKGGHAMALDWREHDMFEEMKEWQAKRK